MSKENIADWYQHWVWTTWRLCKRSISSLIVLWMIASDENSKVFGWQDESLQLAMDNQCYLRNCSRLPSQMPPDKNKCSIPVTAPENIDGCELQIPSMVLYLLLFTFFLRC